jgi:hypothetical protein
MKAPSPLKLLALLVLAGGMIGLLLTLSSNPEPSVAKTPPAEFEKQIRELEQHSQYLQSQNESLTQQLDQLAKENSRFTDELMRLGLKAEDLQKLTQAPESLTQPQTGQEDFVSQGVEILKFRELTALPMISQKASTADIEASILRWLKNQQPGDEPERLALALHALGWIETPVNPLTKRAALLSKQIGGWYDLESQTLLLREDTPTTSAEGDATMAMAQAALVRDFSALLFPPAGPEAPADSAKPRWTTDERLAREALLFGDAMLTQFLFKPPAPSLDISDLPAEDPDHPFNQIVMPIYLKELAFFPRRVGYRLAELLHGQSGWKGLDESYRAPPTSTFSVQQKTQNKSAPAAAAEIPWPQQNMLNQKPYWDDCLGAYACYTALRAHLTGADEEAVNEAAFQATSGWAGDRLLVYAAEGQPPRDHSLWITRWQNAEQARAFATAWAQATASRYQLAKLNNTADGEWTLETSGRHLLIRQHGQYVLSVDAASAGFIQAVPASYP